MSEKRLIDADVVIEELCDLADFYLEMSDQDYASGVLHAIMKLNEAPTVDAVEVERYNDLREGFVDFVCSGVHNPAPYCKNRCAECVDGYGWCTYKRCNGFNPDGRKRADDGE